MSMSRLTGTSITRPMRADSSSRSLLGIVLEGRIGRYTLSAVRVPPSRSGGRTVSFYDAAAHGWMTGLRLAGCVTPGELWGEWTWQ